MAHQEGNMVSLNRAYGATLREVPTFVLEEWGPKLKKFSKSCFDLSVGLNVIRTLHFENSMDMNQIDVWNLIPLDSFAFFSGKKDGVTIMLSPKMDEVIIKQKISAGKKNSQLKKSMYIRTDENGFIKDATFIENFKAPNSDLATRVVKVDYNLRGAVDKVTDTRTINSKMDYLASGLPPLSNSLNIEDGRNRSSQIVYVWEKDKDNPIIEHVEDSETLRRADINLDPVRTILLGGTEGLIQRNNKRAIGIDSVKLGEETYPYGYLSKMLPPDKSIKKVF